MKKEKTQSITGRKTERSGTSQVKTDTQSIEPVCPEESIKPMSPTFRDAVDSLGLLSAQCGHAGLRKKHQDIIFQYLCWAGLWLCQYKVEDDFPTKKEAERLLKGLKGDIGDTRDG